MFIQPKATMQMLFLKKIKIAESILFHFISIDGANDARARTLSLSIYIPTSRSRIISTCNNLCDGRILAFFRDTRHGEKA